MTSLKKELNLDIAVPKTATVASCAEAGRALAGAVGMLRGHCRRGSSGSTLQRASLSFSTAGQRHQPSSGGSLWGSGERAGHASCLRGSALC